jgi:D-glycero-D-manno-heptose 1,7-bisphosphate phosphatase
MKPALFLDRDGVINVEKNYVYRIEDFEFIDGIFELCKTAQDLGYAIVVITNQAGIGRGYYTEADFHHLNDWMVEQFRQRGIHIDGVYFCPFHPTGGIGEYRRESYDRKPNPGMLLKARNDLDIDLDRSIMVGDKSSDLQAAQNAGIPQKILFGKIQSTKNIEIQQIFADLQAIRDWLFNSSQRAILQESGKSQYACQ